MSSNLGCFKNTKEFKGFIFPQIVEIIQSKRPYNMSQIVYVRDSLHKGRCSESDRILGEGLREQLQNSDHFSEVGKLAIYPDPQESNFLSAH